MVVRIAREKRLFDAPNERSSHSQATPRLGGLAMFFGFVVATTAAGSLAGSPVSGAVLAGAALIFFTGLHDDLEAISARKKFLVQIAAALLVVFGAGIGLDNWFGVFGVEALPLWLGAPLTVLAVVGIVNAVNLADGVNGLAAGLCLSGALFFGAWFWLHGEAGMTVLALALAGALLGFLHFNFRRKALIFMGDGGSLLAGFVLATLCIRFLQMAGNAPAGSPEFETAPALALASLAMPVFDTLRVFALRIWLGRSPFSADRNHLHHLLLDLGLSHRQTSGLVVAYNISLILLAGGLHGWSVGTSLLLISGLALMPMLGLQWRVGSRRAAAMQGAF